MSSVEVKEQVNNFCRLARNFKDIDAVCNGLTINAMEIKKTMQNNQVPNVSPARPEVFNDFSEIDELQRENEDMKELIGDYHRGTEVMMAAYRQRAMNKMVMNAEQQQQAEAEALSLDEPFDLSLQNIVLQQSNQICKMHELMRSAATSENISEISKIEEISYLRKENVTLKELYKISAQYGSAQVPIRVNELYLEDKSVQTDEVITKDCKVEKVNSTHNIQKIHHDFNEEGDEIGSYSDNEDDDDDNENDNEEDTITVLSLDLTTDEEKIKYAKDDKKEHLDSEIQKK